MDYRQKSLNFLILEKEAAILSAKEDSRDTTVSNKAYTLCIDILTVRFDNELKQHNNDSTKAYDEFIFRKNLDYLRIYTEEFLMLNVDPDDFPFYKKVKKEMRNIINHLFLEIN